MDEIQLLVTQRTRQAKRIKTITDRLLSQPQKSEEIKGQLKMFRFKARDDEKARIQKENWILNILKNLKILSLDKKRQYYNSSCTMMRLLMPDFNEQKQLTDEQLTEGFTEEFINLYADFFENLGEGFESKQSIRHIIRPNNVQCEVTQRTVIIDLVKHLINTTRDTFKQVVLQTHLYKGESFDRLLPSVDHSSIMNSMSVIISRPNYQMRHEECAQMIADKEKYTSPLPIVRPKRPLLTYELLKLDDSGGLYGIYQPLRVLRTFTMIQNDKEKQKQAIALFLKLKQRNNKIKHGIEVWRHRIFGNQKSIHYNFHDLYTKKEIQEIDNERILTPRKLRTGSYRQPEVRNFLKAYLACQTQKQRKPRATGRIHDRYPHYIVLHYDHRYPLELMVNGKRVEGPQNEEISLENKITRYASQIKIKRNYDQSRQFEDKSPKRKNKTNSRKKIAATSKDSRIMEKQSVSKQKQRFLPDVNLKSSVKLPAEQSPTIKKLSSQKERQNHSVQLQFFTSRSAKVIKFEQSTKKDMINIKAFTRSKNLDEVSNGTLQLLKLIRQYNDMKQKPL